MTHFGEILKEARIRARLTQQELAKKVGIHHSYISKMENEDYLPSFDKAEMLAKALGISDDEEKYLKFLSAAEGLKGLKLVKDTVGQTVGQSQRAISTPMHTMAHPVLAIPDSLLDTTFDQMEADIKSRHLSEAELERLATGLQEANRLLLNLIKPQDEK